MVDTGAEPTWINATVLESIGIERRKKDLQFQLANGQIITRSVGYAILTVNKSETVDEVVFAEAGDLQLLGARALDLEFCTCRGHFPPARIVGPVHSRFHSSTTIW
ncbi:MAG: retroviral-like aspartic protease family protein [Acidobacteria bacterium]|nr:retroviral-like aspartic protease family protein [Acidobacteriota bacterium]